MFSIQKQYKTGIYRTSGSISNFRCRLTIRKIHSLIDVPILEGLDRSLEDRESAEHGKNETRIICWQEKIFSHYEKNYYRIKENCKTEHHKKYYQMLKSESHAPHLLFTYVDEDNYYPADNDNRNLRQQQQSLVPPIKTQSMYLMADLGHEVLLFSIIWCPEEGLLTVYPDFNLMTTNPFYHEMRESNLHMYHYALERCLSGKLDPPKPANQFALIGAMQTVRSRPVDRKEHFDMPKQLHRNLLFLIEIVSAADFKYDGIHIRYRFELPADVKMVNKDSQLSGSTHASKQLNGCWHFAHCHELLLNLPDSKEFQHCLDIYFEAIAIDDWCRERYLGHSHLSLPLQHQMNETTINFVQLTNSGALADRMERFLVGNRRQVDLPSFYGKAGVTILNRYANETISSGKLQIRFQMVRQHQPKIINDGYFKSTRKTKNITLKELIKSYSMARERLEEFVDLKY